MGKGGINEGWRYHVFGVFGIESYGTGAIAFDVLFDKSHPAIGKYIDKYGLLGVRSAM